MWRRWAGIWGSFSHQDLGPSYDTSQWQVRINKHLDPSHIPQLNYGNLCPRRAHGLERGDWKSTCKRKPLNSGKWAENPPAQCPVAGKYAGEWSCLLVIHVDSCFIYLNLTAGGGKDRLDGSLVWLLELLVSSCILLSGLAGFTVIHPNVNLSGCSGTLPTSLNAYGVNKLCSKALYGR